MRKASTGGPVLLFDGECGLCTALAGWALARGRKAGLCVAPLQGEAGQGLLRALGLPTGDFDTLVFVADRARPQAGHMLRSDGALAVLVAAGGGWGALAGVLRVIPRGWRDAAYRGVARVRKRLFGGPRPIRVEGADAERLLQ